MKKWLSWLMILVLLCPLAAWADGVYSDPVPARLVQKMATRSGPGTKYTEELGTYPDNTAITAITQAVTNGMGWVQVEFSYSGRLYRAYTPLSRVQLQGEVPYESAQMTDDVTLSASTVYYGPGTNYTARYRQIAQGTQVKVVLTEGTWALCEYLENGQWTRGYLPVSVLKTTTGSSVPGGSSTGSATTRGGTRVMPIQGRTDRWSVPVKSADAAGWTENREDPGAMMPLKAVDGREDTWFSFTITKTPLGQATLSFEFLESAAVDEIWIKSGVWKDTGTYGRYSRPKTLTVQYRYPGSAAWQDGVSVMLQDDKTLSAWQVIPLGSLKKAAGIRFTITECYWGSAYPAQVCISEVLFVKK